MPAKRDLGDRLRVLAITSLFPNAVSPHGSAFNRQQLAALAALCELELWAPVPWFPFAPRLLPRSSAGRAAAVPRSEQVAGLEVSHPRTLQLPIVGRPIAGPLYAASLARSLWRRRGDFDVVLSTWAYPDGWAATVLGEVVGVPTVVKVHGSDINVVANKAVQRAQLRAVLPWAAGVIAVSRPLAERVVGLGVEPARAHWIPNGVDGERFAVREAGAARESLSIERDGEIVVYIGNLKREKGVLDLLDAWSTVASSRTGARLYIIGGGDEAEAVNARGRALAGVTAVGPVAHADVATWMTASDLLCLPSWSEGMPNVVIEAHASGRAVVGTAVGGTPDLITGPTLGRLVAARDPAALANALVEALASPVAPADVLAASRTISWPESAARVYQVLTAASARRL